MRLEEMLCAGWYLSLAASSEAADNLDRSHSMQSACEARLQNDLKLHGVHSRARNGIEANISYHQATSAKRELPASQSCCLTQPCVPSEASMSSRCEGRNADGGEAADSGTSRLCTRDGVLSRCTTNLLSPPRFTPLLSALSLSKLASPNLSRPQPPGTTHPIPRSRRTTPPMSSPAPWRPPLLHVVLLRSGTKAALSCTVLSDSPVTPLPTNH